MPSRKKCSLISYHKKTGEVKFCPRCGKMVKSYIKFKPDCISRHLENKKTGHHFCPDCGVPLNILRGLINDSIKNALQTLKACAREKISVSHLHANLTRFPLDESDFDPEQNASFVLMLHQRGFHRTATEIARKMAGR